MASSPRRFLTTFKFWRQSGAKILVCFFHENSVTQIRAFCQRSFLARKAANLFVYIKNRSHGYNTFAYHHMSLSQKFQRFLPIRQKPIGVKFNTFLAYQYFILSPFFPIRMYFCLSENTFLVKILAITIFQYILHYCLSNY